MEFVFSLPFDPRRFVLALGYVLPLPFGYGVFGFGHRLLLAALIAFIANEQIILFDPLYGVFEFPKYLFAGALIALPLVCLVGFGEMFGELYDSQRGQTFAAIYDPTSQSSAGQSALLFRYYLLAALVLSDGFLKSLLRTVSVVPPGDSLLRLGKDGLLFFIELGTECVLLFLPLALVLFVVDLGVAVIGKLLPQLSLVSESFAFKSLLGAAILLALHSGGVTESVSVISETILL